MHIKWYFLFWQAFEKILSFVDSNYPLSFFLFFSYSKCGYICRDSDGHYADIDKNRYRNNNSNNGFEYAVTIIERNSSNIIINNIIVYDNVQMVKNMSTIDIHIPIFFMNFQKKSNLNHVGKPYIQHVTA